MRRFRDQSGQAVVEMALVLPILVLFIFGIISYGLYVNAVDTVQQAARLGVRAAALGDTMGCPGDSAETELGNGQPATVYGVVDDQLNNNKALSPTSGGNPLPVISYAAMIGNQSNSQANDILMTVAYAYHPVIPIPGLLPSTVEIAETYQMMVETAPASNAITAIEPTGSPYDESTQWTQPTPPSSNVSYLVQPNGCQA